MKKKEDDLTIVQPCSEKCLERVGEVPISQEDAVELLRHDSKRESFLNRSMVVLLIW
jgi:hypothetical protein